MMTHLTDTDIQNLLDGNSFSNLNVIKEHLARCESCRESFRTYETLRLTLSTEIPLPFGPGFTDRLLARIPSVESRKKIPVSTIVSGGLLAMGGIGYGLSLLLPRLEREISTFRPVFAEIHAAGNSVTAFLSRNFGSPALIVTAFTAIGLVMLIDRFFIQPRLNPAKTHERGRLRKNPSPMQVL